MTLNSTMKIIQSNEVFNRVEATSTLMCMLLSIGVVGGSTVWLLTYLLAFDVITMFPPSKWTEEFHAAVKDRAENAMLLGSVSAFIAGVCVAAIWNTLRRDHIKRIDHAQRPVSGIEQSDLAS